MNELVFADRLGETVKESVKTASSKCQVNPNELIRTQKGARLYWLWEREKNPQKKEKYQEEFNKLLEGEVTYENSN